MPEFSPLPTLPPLFRFELTLALHTAHCAAENRGKNKESKDMKNILINFMGQR
jgi:hypothetical protein